MAWVSATPKSAFSLEHSASALAYTASSLALRASSLAHSVTFLAPSAAASFCFRSTIYSLAICSCSSTSSRYLVWSLAYFWVLARLDSVLSLALVISFKPSLAFRRSALEFLRVRVASKHLSCSRSRVLLWSLAASSNL